MKCGSIEDGLLVFKKLPETSVVLWDVVICGHVQNAEFLFARNQNQAGLVDDGYACFQSIKEGQAQCTNNLAICLV